MIDIELLKKKLAVKANLIEERNKSLGLPFYTKTSDYIVHRKYVREKADEVRKGQNVKFETTL